MAIPSALGEAISARLTAWEADRVADRLWASDGSLWATSGKPAAALAAWLGWLDLPARMAGRLGELERLAREVSADGYSQVAVLGMGGSSLAPDLFGSLFDPGSAGAELRILDSTHPDAVRDLRSWAESARTLFCVSSKSGSTTEPNAFYAAMAEHAPALDFVAITDPGSSLAAMARAQGFRAIVDGEPDVGGRYSALSAFGLLPAALHGVDIASLLDRAAAMAAACRRPAPQNPGLQLGATLGEAALAGRDKLTIFTSARLAGLGGWIEQLVAESTGKEGRGIIPVVGEGMGSVGSYGSDRLFVFIGSADEPQAEAERLADDLELAGHPVMRFVLRDALAVGAEFFRWQVATAAAGMVLGIDPFDQPNVQESKDATLTLLETYRRDGLLPSPAPMVAEPGISAYADPATLGDAPVTVTGAVRALLDGLRPGGYLALLPFLPGDAITTGSLARMRTVARDRLRVATTAGIGPRFLHSTGQLHKGGPNSGAFLQITGDPRRDLPIPGWQESFGTLIAAQALGDLDALQHHRRRVVRLHLADPASGLGRVESMIIDAAATTET